MKKALILLLHISYWFAYLLILFHIFAAATHGFHEGPSMAYILRIGLAFTIVPGALAFYFAHSFLFSKYLKPQRFQQLIGVGSAGLFGTSLLGLLALKLVLGSRFDSASPFQSLTSIFLFLFFISLGNAVIGLVVRGFVHWFDEIRLRQQLQEEKHQIELELVKAQLDPHFIFNSINNIDVLIQKEPETASNYLNKLSEMLRYTLYNAQETAVSLQKEVDCIQQYIDLQRIRTKSPDFVQFETDGSFESVRIAPMVLLPFVENAFKHSGNKKIAGAIQISISARDGEIHFSCINRLDQQQNRALDKHGLGNDLMKKRLNLLYPGKNKLSIEHSAEQYSLNLMLR